MEKNGGQIIMIEEPKEEQMYMAVEKLINWVENDCRRCPVYLNRKGWPGEGCPHNFPKDGKIVSCREILRRWAYE